MAIGFDFTDEQQLLAESLREKLEAEVAPTYMQRATKENVCGWRGILKELAKLDLLGYGIPEEYGGKGDIDTVTQGIIQYELGRVDEAWALCWGDTHSPLFRIIGAGNNTRLKNEVLPRAAKGEILSTGLLTEPQGGSDLGDIKVTARLEGDEWVINGTKASVSFCEADYYFTLCKLEGIDTDNAHTYNNLGMICIPSATPGVSHLVYKDYGLKQVSRGDVYLDNARVPKDNLVVTPGAGFQKVMGLFDCARPMLATLAVGCADRVLEKTVEFCKTRMSFCRPLAKYEAVSFGLAEHATKLHAARLLALEAFEKNDRGVFHARESAAAKWYGCEESFNAIWFCLRLFGHMGYTEDMEYCQRLLDTMGWAWGDGGWEVQKIVVAREIGGREFLPYDRVKKNK